MAEPPKMLDPKLVVRQVTRDSIRTITLKRESGGVPVFTLMEIDNTTPTKTLRWSDELYITTPEQFDLLWKVLTGLL